MNLTLIHTDKRGDVNIIKGSELGFPEVTIFYTKRGMARGGCVHRRSFEFACVISGVVRYYVGDKDFLMQEGDNLIIRVNTPHYFVSLTDSVVLEWGAKPEEKNEKDPEFRKMVDRINANQHPS